MAPGLGKLTRLQVPDTGGACLVRGVLFITLALIQLDFVWVGCLLLQLVVLLRLCDVGGVRKSQMALLAHGHWRQPLPPSRSCRR